MDATEIQNQINAKNSQLNNAKTRIMELAEEIKELKASKEKYKTMIIKLKDAKDFLIEARKDMFTAKTNLTNSYSSDETDSKIATLGNIRNSINKKVENLGTIIDRAETKKQSIQEKIDKKQEAIDLFKENILNWTSELNQLTEQMNNLNQ